MSSGSPSPIRMLALASCFVLYLGTVGRAGPDAIPSPLPDGFFNERTIAFGRIELAAVNLDRMCAALRAILPAVPLPITEETPEWQWRWAAMRIFAENPEIMKQQLPRHPNNPMSQALTLVDQLMEAGFTHLFVVAHARDNAQELPRIYFLLSCESTDTPEVRRQLTEIAGRFGLIVQLSGGWFVASAEKTLPEPGDEFGLYDAAFMDAMLSNPDHDFMVTFVPTEEMRKVATTGLREVLIEEKEPQIEALVELAERVMRGDWFYASAHLGEAPLLRAAANFADAEECRAVTARFQNMLELLKKEIGDDDHNRIAREVFKFLGPDTEEQLLTWELNSKRLSALLSTAMEADRKKWAESN